MVDDMCACSWPRISPDGGRAAVSITDATTGNADIWVYELDGGGRRRLTFDLAYETNPEWAADGGAVIFTSTLTGTRNIHRIDSRNRGSQEVLLTSDDEKFVQSTSVDGRWLVFYQVPKERSSLDYGDLWLLTLSKERRAEPFLTTEHSEQFGHISPDGRWFVYQSNESGKNEVYVTSFPERTGKWLVSEEGGILPKWSASGQEIFYLNQEHSTLFAAAVTTQGPAFQISNVQRLFSAPMVAGRGYPYDVSKDGQRFLVITTHGATTTPLTLVIDWPSELNR